MAGVKLKRNFRAGALSNSERAASDFFQTAIAPRVAASRASINQTFNHLRGDGCREAPYAAISAVAPITTPPQPGTAVKAPERSIVSRMNRRLSRAWSCIDKTRLGCAAIVRV